MIPGSCLQGRQHPQTKEILAKQKGINSTSGSSHTVEYDRLGWKQKSLGVGLKLTSSFSYMQTSPLHQSLLIILKLTKFKTQILALWSHKLKPKIQIKWLLEIKPMLVEN